MPVLTMIVFLLPTTVSDIQMILKKKKSYYMFAYLQIPKMLKSFHFLLLWEP